MFPAMLLADVWGSTLTFCLVAQFITGISLWMAYSPSSQTAWESVYFIQDEMTGGWLLRGMHHYTAHVMTVLLVLHLMQVMIDGAYKAPREVNFWFGLALLGLVLAMSPPAICCPGDQKAIGRQSGNEPCGVVAGRAEPPENHHWRL
jgi:ubiquinol-cytochrome c reductase cytochrome b subunit